MTAEERAGAGSSRQESLPVAVVVPAYRVADRVAGVVTRIPPFVAHIVVVDDASPDDIAGALSGIRDPRLCLLRHARNQGVGGAMLTGYEQAVKLGCDIVVKMDGDGQMDPDRIADLIAPLTGGRADYAKGNRFLHTVALQQMPAVRRFGNIILTFLTKCASGYWFLFDPTNGFTALHTTVWPRLQKERIDRRFFFESSMLIELGCIRAVVEDVPIPARYHGEESSLSPARAAFEFPWKLVRGTFRRMKMWYFLYDFTPVSLFIVAGPLLILFAVLWGGARWWRSYSTGIPSPTGTIMLVVVTLILGVQLVLQALALDMQNVPKRPLQRLARAGKGRPHEEAR